MVDTASPLRALLAHARLCPASEHPELPPATATALPTRPQSSRVTRRLQPKSTSASFSECLSLACALLLSRSHPSVLSSFTRVCHVDATGSHPLRRIRRRRRLCHECLRTHWVCPSSAQLGSSPSRGPSSGATHQMQRHTSHVHLFCIPIHHPPQDAQHLPCSKGSEMMHRIKVDSCTPCLLRLAPTSISFPYFPCCHCAQASCRQFRHAASHTRAHPILGGHSSDT